MTDDGIHPEADGKKVFAYSFPSAVGYSANPYNYPNKKTIKILGIGNSHTQTYFWYLYEILAHAGYKPITGHFYWGGSSLEAQY